MNRLNFSALLVAIFFAVFPSAQAHSSLISSEPSEGQSLNVIPQTLTLAFNEDLIEIENQVVNSLTLVNKSSGESTPLVVTTSGPSLMGEIPVGTYSVGGYQLKYRVVSADGHPITGTISFSTTGQTIIKDSSTPVNPSQTTEEPAPKINTLSRTSQMLYAAGTVVAFGVWALLQRRRRS